MKKHLLRVASISLTVAIVILMVSSCESGSQSVQETVTATSSGSSSMRKLPSWISEPITDENLKSKTSAEIVETLKKVFDTDTNLSSIQRENLYKLIERLGTVGEVESPKESSAVDPGSPPQSKPDLKDIEIHTKGTFTGVRIVTFEGTVTNTGNQTVPLFTTQVRFSNLHFSTNDKEADGGEVIATLGAIKNLGPKETRPVVWTYEFYVADIRSTPDGFTADNLNLGFLFHSQIKYEITAVEAQSN